MAITIWVDQRTVKEQMKAFMHELGDSYWAGSAVREHRLTELMGYAALLDVDQGRIAPSAIVSRGLGITKSGLIFSLEPKPWQSGQAPWGELKLKERG